MAFKLIKKLENGVRIGELETAHGVVKTPFFMPVATQGSVKAASADDLRDLGAGIVLSNTYHLYLRPGEQLIKELGGLHSFMRWNGPILTDSGGYQVFSLGKDNSKSQISNVKSISNDKLSNVKNGKSLVKITDDGVEFTSHLDGSKHMFTPEKVIQIQLDLGVDVLMPLDVCPSGKASKEEVKEACELTIAWAKRAKKYFDEQVENIPTTKRPLLHGIVQGGLFPDLRKWCAEELIELNFDGYSVGGLAVDLETREMWDIVKLMGEMLPQDKQRYLMGVGTPDDIIQGTKLGMDMFDCVLPTRMARHGNVYIKSQQSTVNSLKSSVESHQFELINLLNSKYRTDRGVIDEKCGCSVCRAPMKSDSDGEIPDDQSEYRDSGGYSRAYVSHLLRSGEIMGLRLTTLHNLHTYLDLMRKLAQGDL